MKKNTRNKYLEQLKHEIDNKVSSSFNPGVSAYEAVTKLIDILIDRCKHCKNKCCEGKNNIITQFPHMLED